MCSPVSADELKEHEKYFFDNFQVMKKSMHDGFAKMWKKMKKNFKRKSFQDKHGKGPTTPEFWGFHSKRAQHNHFNRKCNYDNCSPFDGAAGVKMVPLLDESDLIMTAQDWKDFEKVRKVKIHHCRLKDPKEQFKNIKIPLAKQEQQQEREQTVHNLQDLIQSEEFAVQGVIAGLESVTRRSVFDHNATPRGHFNIYRSHGSRMGAAFYIMFIYTRSHDTRREMLLESINGNGWNDALKLSTRSCENLLYGNSQAVQHYCRCLGRNPFHKEMLNHEHGSLNDQHSWFVNGFDELSQRNGCNAFDTQQIQGTWASVDPDDSEEMEEYACKMYSEMPKNGGIESLHRALFVAQASAFYLDVDTRQREDNQPGVNGFELLRVLVLILKKVDFDELHQKFTNFLSIARVIDDSGKIEEDIENARATIVRLFGATKALLLLGTFEFEELVNNKYIHTAWICFLVAAVLSIIVDVIKLESTVDSAQRCCDEMKKGTRPRCMLSLTLMRIISSFFTDI